MSSAEEIRDLTDQKMLTHLFTGQPEYMTNPDFFEELSEVCQIIVITGNDMRLPRGSSVRQIRMPISGFSIVQALRDDQQARDNAEIFGMGRMYCPGVRALVVDDENMNLVVAKGILRDYKISVDTALSGAEAIEKCSSSDYDIIFMDHMMPDMDGIEAAKRIRRLSTEKKQVIVALTANAVSGAREMFLSEGFDEFISKPIELTVLERVLRKVLSASSITYEAKESNDEEEPRAEIFDSGYKVPASFGSVFLKKMADIGLDVEEAILSCKGEEEFYGDLLEVFADEADKLAEAGKYDEIRGFCGLIGMNGTDLPDERIVTMLHGIRKNLMKR